MVPPLSLTIEACEAAVADAGLTLDDIDGLSTYPGGGNIGGFGEGGVTALEAALGIRPTWHNGGIETFGPGGSVIAAMIAIAGGLARHVLCFRTLWEATFNELMKQGKIVPSGGRTRRLADAVRRHVGGTHVGAERAAPLSSIRHHERDARLDRVEPARQRRAQPDGRLPRRR